MLRCHDVFFVTRELGLGPPQPRRRFVCHHATPLKLEGVECKKHNCGL